MAGKSISRTRAQKKQGFRPYSLIVTAITCFVLVILVAHFLTPAEYDWTQNTVSDLAAQQYENAWLMRAGFIGFGAMMGIAMLWAFVEGDGKDFSDLLIMMYAVSVLLSGVWSAAPFGQARGFSAAEDQMHSLFAQIAGIVFSLAILVHLLFFARKKEKLLHFIFLLLVLGFSALVGLAKNDALPLGMGLVQRGLYLVSFVWLLLRYHRS